MPAVFLQGQGPLLLVAHALCALALGGACVHQAVVAARLLFGRGGRGRPLRLARLYALLTVLLYIGTVVMGSLLYPRYRIHVRALYLDRYAVWAANLFDIKENLAALGLPLAVGALVLARDLRAHEGDRAALRLYGLLAGGTALVCLFNLVAGLLCTGVRGA